MGMEMLTVKTKKPTMLISMIRDREVLILLLSSAFAGISKVIAETFSPLLGLGAALLGIMGGAVVFYTLLIKRKQANYDYENSRLENEIKKISLDRLRKQVEQENNDGKN